MPCPAVRFGVGCEHQFEGFGSLPCQALRRRSAAMCERLGQLRDAVGRYAAGFDASLLSTVDAGLAVVEAAAIEKMAATVKALAAVRAAEGGAWREAGGRSAAHHLA